MTDRQSYQLELAGFLTVLALFWISVVAVAVRVLW